MPEPPGPLYHAKLITVEMLVYEREVVFLNHNGCLWLRRDKRDVIPYRSVSEVIADHGKLTVRTQSGRQRSVKLTPDGAERVQRLILDRLP